MMIGRKRWIRVFLPAVACLALLVAWQAGVRDEPAQPAGARTTDASRPAPGVTGTERIVLAQNDAPASSGRFQLGTHYERLSPTQPTSSSPDQIEVAEIFWYGCPHCYTFDPYLESWKQDIPGNVSFVRIPAVWNPLLQLHARAYYTAEALGKGEEMHAPIFREIHVNGNPLDSEQALQAFFGQFDVGPEAFTDAFNSFAVHTRLQRAGDLSRRYRIASVPTVIVNGKYSTDATAAGGYDLLMDLIDELIAMEAAGN